MPAEGRPAPDCYEALDQDLALCPHCWLDAGRDSATDDDARSHTRAERRPCQHCGGPMHANFATRCPHCASWAVKAEEIERFGTD